MRRGRHGLPMCVSQVGGRFRRRRAWENWMRSGVWWKSWGSTSMLVAKRVCVRFLCVNIHYILSCSGYLNFTVSVTCLHDLSTCIYFSKFTEPISYALSSAACHDPTFAGSLTRYDYIGITALDAATMDERMDVMRYLLDHGADPNKRTNSGFVPLHCAARKGRDEAAKLLLSSGASVDIAFSDGTPLHFAAACGTIGVMKVLLQHNADPNKLSEIGGTPLSETLCATNKGLPETILLKCVKLLVEAGADVNCTTQNPLVIATTHGLTNCVKYLLKAGADPNIPQCHCGVKPIELAASSGMRKLVELLFPLTSPILTVPNWTVDGIMAHANSRPSKPKVKPVKNTKVQLKSYGEKAVQRKDYDGAAMFYTEAIELDPTDATLYSNRSLCHLEMTEAEKALQDANTCIRLRPEWIKGHYRKGAALMSLKDYTKACDAFMVGLQLDPGNAEMEKAFRGAVEAMKADHLARKGLKPSS
uniref:Uncharacterized protein n=1 Tax=Avena sativa TaxID=4498 RepID=A0ACD5XAH1_AVESA